MAHRRFGHKTHQQVFKVVSETTDTITVERIAGGANYVNMMVFFANVLALERGKDVKFFWNSPLCTYHIRARGARRWLRAEVRGYLESIEKMIRQEFTRFIDDIKQCRSRRRLWLVECEALATTAENARRHCDPRLMRWYLGRFPDTVFSWRKPLKAKPKKINKRRRVA